MQALCLGGGKLPVDDACDVVLVVHQDVVTLVVVVAQVKETTARHRVGDKVRKHCQPVEKCEVVVDWEAAYLAIGNCSYLLVD